MPVKEEIAKLKIYSEMLGYSMHPSIKSEKAYVKKLLTICMSFA